MRQERGKALSRPGGGIPAYRITSIPIVGWAARKASRLYREGSVTRIRSGIGKGLLWKRSHRFQSGFHLGTYEPVVQEFLAKNLAEGSVFWDVGANAGFFSLLSSRLVGKGGHVIAFEPFPSNARSVREQIELNELGSVCEVKEVAVSARNGTARLAITSHNATHRLATDGDLEVETVTLDSIIRDRPTRAPDVIKVDVEGAEVEVLEGASHLLEHGPIWLIEIHRRGDESRLRFLLEQGGYRISGRGVEGREERLLIAKRK